LKLTSTQDITGGNKPRTVRNETLSSTDKVYNSSGKYYLHSSTNNSLDEYRKYSPSGYSNSNYYPSYYYYGTGERKFPSTLRKWFDGAYYDYNYSYKKRVTTPWYSNYTYSYYIYTNDYPTVISSYNDYRKF